MCRLGEATVLPDPDDPAFVRVEFAFEWMDQAQAAAFGLGHIVEVLEPPELRDQMVKVARAVLARYASAAGPSTAEPESAEEAVALLV